MNIFSTLLFIASALLLIGLGLVSLINDLLGRGPHDAPLIEDDGLAWPPRYRGSLPPESAVSRLCSQVDIQGSRGN